jgi:hypothetical protein
MRIRTRIDELERSVGASEISDHKLLVQLLGRRDSLFWPHRHSGDSRVAVLQRQREYLSGAVGISAKADGKTNWKAMFEARQRLISGGFLRALFSGGQVTSMFLTPKGEATARVLVGSRLRSLREAIRAYVLLSTDKWTSESELFGETFVGDPSSWEDATELVLPLLTSGLAEASSDNAGKVGYRKTDRELPEDEPDIDVGFDETMDEIYIRSFKAERKSLRQCEPIDVNEVFVPLVPLRNYEEK